MTDKVAGPDGSGLSKGLGPNAEAYARWLADTHAPALRKLDSEGAHAAGYAAGVAAERARLKADAEEWGNALNEAGWEATEAYRRHTGQVEPAIFFNHAKGILRDALAVYFKALGA